MILVAIIKTLHHPDDGVVLKPSILPTEGDFRPENCASVTHCVFCCMRSHKQFLKKLDVFRAETNRAQQKYKPSVDNAAYNTDEIDVGFLRTCTVGALEFSALLGVYFHKGIKG